VTAHDVHECATSLIYGVDLLRDGVGGAGRDCRSQVCNGIHGMDACILTENLSMELLNYVMRGTSREVGEMY
jgi:hypothetical protein